MINVDYLRSWGKTPQMNGLGFIWLNRTANERWNFYHPTLTPVVVDEYHNHRSTFRSVVMQGKLFNKRGVVVHGNQVMRNIDCITYLKKGKTPDFPYVQQGVAILEGETEQYNVGDIYEMRSTEMHKVWVEEPTITKLTRMPGDTLGLAVYDKDKQPVCPIADFVTPEDKCWEIIEQICQ
jgi:hypothetical protein